MKKIDDIFLNDKFNEYTKNIENGEESFKVKKGIIPIIISAPHCVDHVRNWKILGKETGTGEIVQILADLLDCWCIYKNRNYNDDANYNLIDNNLYKQEILKIVKENNIRFLIDIHGASDKNGFDVEIGTDNYKNINGKKEILDKLIIELKNNGIENINVDKKFKASTINTISKSIFEKANIPCLQIEITKKIRNIKNEKEFKSLIKSIYNWIKIIWKE